MFRLFVYLLFMLSSICLPASEILSADANDDGKADRWYALEGETLLEYTADRNFDGIVDQIVRFTEEGIVACEEFDFNLDGRMDDFYYYADGALLRREIDSNYDDAADIWVYLVDGIYVSKTEQDTDFDGRVDTVRDYSNR